MPQEPQMAILKKEQARILSAHPEGRLPSFDPHVTLIGGVEIYKCFDPTEIEQIHNLGMNFDENAAQVVLKRLQSAFRGFGGVTCEFDAVGGVSVQFNKDGTLKWNQACISVVQKTSTFMNAMEIADEALFGEDSLDDKVERHFRKPISEPHYSFVYTDNAAVANAVVEMVQCPSSFRCSKIAMWWTDPPTLDAIRDHKWKFIGEIDMAGLKDSML
jgi:hypothetical protein